MTMPQMGKPDRQSSDSLVETFNLHPTCDRLYSLSQVPTGCFPALRLELQRLASKLPRRSNGRPSAEGGPAPPGGLRGQRAPRAPLAPEDENLYEPHLNCGGQISAIRDDTTACIKSHEEAPHPWTSHHSQP